jgi:hypothetical protein
MYHISGIHSGAMWFTESNQSCSEI